MYAPTQSGSQHHLDRGRESLPLLDLITEGTTTAGRDVVVPRAAVILGELPVAFDESLVLEPLQRGVQRTLVHFELPLRHLLNAQPNAPTMHWLEIECLEDEQVDAAPQGVWFECVARRHGFALLFSEWEGVCSCLLLEVKR